jgi:hypothetical protein
MNSAEVHKTSKSDQGMDVRKLYIAPGFKSLTPGEGKELLFRVVNLGGPELQQRLDSVGAPGRTGLTMQGMIVPIPKSLGSHGLADG